MNEPKVRGDEVNPYEAGGLLEESKGKERTGEVNGRRSQRLGGGLGIASLVAALGFVGWLFQLSSGLSLFVAMIAGLVASPYLLIWLACRDFQFWFARILVAGILGGCCALGIYAFDKVDEDAQGGLILLIIPIYQLVGVFVLLIVSAIVDRLGRRFF